MGAEMKIGPAQRPVGISVSTGIYFRFQSFFWLGRSRIDECVPVCNHDEQRRSCHIPHEHQSDGSGRSAPFVFANNCRNDFFWRWRIAPSMGTLPQATDGCNDGGNHHYRQRQRLTAEGAATVVPWMLAFTPSPAARWRWNSSCFLEISSTCTADVR